MNIEINNRNYKVITLKINKMKNLQDLFEHELIDLYSAEKQLTEALPKMAEAATNKDLKNGFKEHLKETEHQLERVKGILDDLGVKPGNKKCKGMEGLIKEGEDIMKEDAPSKVKDAALISAAQRVEHYEMAGYGTASEFARMLGHDEHAKTLETILAEETKADQKLNGLALKEINKKAM